MALKRHPDSVLVIFGMRHGNRNPEEFLPNDDRTWGFEGPMELTQFGVRQSIGFGRTLATFLGRRFVRSLNGDNAELLCSSASRCQGSLQQVSSALLRRKPSCFVLRPKHVNITYSIDDTMLRTYNVQHPAIEKIWAPILDDTLPELARLREEKRDLLECMAENTGWEASVARAADVADNITQARLNAAALPAWLSRELVEQFAGLAEAHQIACAKNEHSRAAMGGLWLAHILRNLRHAQSGKGLSLLGYCSHTEVTLSVMKLLGFGRDDVGTAAGFIVELRLRPVPAVRLLEHESFNVDGHIVHSASLVPEIAQLVDKDGFVELAKYLPLVEKHQITDLTAYLDRLPA